MKNEGSKDEGRRPDLVHHRAIFFVAKRYFDIIVVARCHGAVAEVEKEVAFRGNDPCRE